MKKYKFIVLYFLFLEISRETDSDRERQSVGPLSLIAKFVNKSIIVLCTKTAQFYTIIHSFERNFEIAIGKWLFTRQNLKGFIFYNIVSD